MQFRLEAISLASKVQSKRWCVQYGRTVGAAHSENKTQKIVSFPAYSAFRAITGFPGAYASLVVSLFRARMSARLRIAIRLAPHLHLGPCTRALELLARTPHPID